MTYKLPMNDDGTVDIEKFNDWLFSNYLTRKQTVSALKSIVSHYEARGAEKEREACVFLAKTEWAVSPNGKDSGDRIAAAIRARAAEGEKE